MVMQEDTVNQVYRFSRLVCLKQITQLGSEGQEKI